MKTGRETESHGSVSIWEYVINTLLRILRGFKTDKGMRDDMTKEFSRILANSRYQRDLTDTNRAFERVVNFPIIAGNVDGILPRRLSPQMPRIIVNVMYT